MSVLNGTVNVSDHAIEFAAALGLICVTATIGLFRRRQPNPVLFHNAAWIGSFTLLSLGWVDYIPIGGSAWLIILAGILAFNLGALTPSIFERPKSQIVPVRIDIPGAQTIVPLLFLVGFAWYLLNLSSVFGLSNVIFHPGSVRSTQFTTDYVTSFALPGRLLYSLGPLVVVTYACPWLVNIRVSKFRRAAVLVATVIAMSLSLGRTYIFISLVWTTSCYFIYQPQGLVQLKNRVLARRTKFRRRLVIVFGAVLAIASFQLLAAELGKTEGNNGYILPYTSWPLTASPFTSVYVYSTGGVPAFASEVAGSSPIEGPPDPSGKLGWATFYPFVKSIPGWEAAPLIRPFNGIPFAFNAYTWFDPLYRDFGFVGVLVGPYALGTLVALLIVRKRRTAEGALFSGLLLTVTLFAPFISKFNDPAIWDVSLALLVLRLWPRGRMKNQATDGQSLEVVAINSVSGSS